MCFSCWQLSAESTVNTYQSVRFARITPCASSCFKVIKEQNKIRHVWRSGEAFVMAHSAEGLIFLVNIESVVLFDVKKYNFFSGRRIFKILSQGIMLDRGWGIV